MEKVEWWQSPMVPAAVMGAVALVIGYAACGRSKPEPPAEPPPVAVARTVEAPSPPPEDLPTAAPPRHAATPTGIPIFTTKPGHVGAATKAQLDKAIGLIAAGDEAAFSQYVTTTPGVFLLKEGVEVVVVDAGKLFGGVVQVRQKGTTTEFWTSREALSH